MGYRKSSEHRQLVSWAESYASDKISYEMDTSVRKPVPGGGNIVNLGKIRMFKGWAERQAEGIVDAFLADGEPEDLLRLEQAIANALRLAYERRRAMQRRRVRGSSGTREKQRKKS